MNLSGPGNRNGAELFTPRRHCDTNYDQFGFSQE